MKELLVFIGLFVLLLSCADNQPEKTGTTDDNYGIENQLILSNIENGIHSPTGLAAGQGLESVLRRCISCHSSKLIIQNRATEEGWRSMIHWMYETQNLPRLGDEEQVIISYLGKHYAPVDSGRRKALEIDEWYNLDVGN